MMHGVLIFLSTLTFFDTKMLENNLPQSDKRFHTFQHVLKLLSEKNVHTMVETGTARCGKSNFIGDGGATYIFGEWASQNQATLYSVDIDQKALVRAAKALETEMVPYVQFIHSDSVQFLQQFSSTIDFLYLDSYDFEIDNPAPSQQHHLNEIMAAYPHLTENSIVMIDDCDLPGGGKGKLAIEYLQQKGWRIVRQGYQVILLKGQQ